MAIHSEGAPTLSAFVLRELQDSIGMAASALARRLGMSSTDALAIEYISLSTTPLSPGELGQRLAITRSSATEVVDRLVAAGHIERVRDDIDRRRYRLLPTSQARNRVRNELQPLVRALDGAAHEFSPQDQAVISTYLRSVIDAYRGFASDPQDPGAAAD
ncbi:MAG: MarR family winged helix-turn-helix transcriptional regulator [Dietzia sp.]